MWVHNVICHPCGNGKHTAYKHGDDRGMVYGMVLPTFYPLSAKKSWHSTWIYLVQGCSSTNLDDRKEHDLLASSWHVLIHIPTTNWTTSSKWMLKSWIWWLGDLSSWLDDWNLYVSDDMNSLDDAILTRFGWFSKHTVIRCAPNSGCHTSPSIL